MDSADWRRPDELSPVPPVGRSTGRDRAANPDPSRDRIESSRRRARQFGLAVRQWRQYATVHGRRSAAIGLGLAFLLLFLSQWLPWANVQPVLDNDRQSAGRSFMIGIDDGTTSLVLTYYLMWVIVLGLAGATVFSSGRARRPLFGASIGAIVVQFVAILPLLRHPKGLVGNDVTNFSSLGDASELLVTRQPGMFFAVIALIVLGGAMVLAVEGRVLPSFDEDTAAEAIAAPAPLVAPVRTDQDDGGVEVIPEVLSELPIEVIDEPLAEKAAEPDRPAAGQVPSPYRPPTAYPVAGAFTVGGVEPVSTEPPPPPAGPSDHSAYTRPLRDEDYRR